MPITDIVINREKNEEIRHSLMAKAPTPTEKSKERDNTKTPPKTSITQQLRTDFGRSVKGNDGQLTSVIKLVYGIPTFPLTTKAV